MGKTQIKGIPAKESVASQYVWSVVPSLYPNKLELSPIQSNIYF